ncbi:hypothetical protein RND81_07G113700 [Saponaria officinalis]|uniref:EF-hand domain-containing protein n=1 Tax=Saponaria officinalis TaxID=3572 RepID=A0AAW1JRM2_SAPOF
MHSRWPFLRKSPPLIRHIILRRFSVRSSSFKNNSGSGNNSADVESSPALLLRWVSSGIFVIGSGFGLCYLTASPSNGGPPFVTAFADQGASENSSDFAEISSEKKTKYLFKDEYRRRVFFNYEKRIRLRSPPEKVFEYFASVRGPNGESFMTPGDLMRAVVPVFPPSESNYVRGGFLKGEKCPGELQCAPSQFFMLFDTNNDGLISFPEFIFLLTVLSIPESSFSVAFKMFDLDHNGEIDREEFQKVMSLMRTYNRQGRQHSDGRRFGLKVSGGGSVENGGLIEYFFGKDGKQALQHHKFVQFLRDLHDEILRLEFAHYDHKGRGTISAKDFALSMVASADMSHTPKFLDQVENLSNDPDLRNIRITYEEFKGFAELRKSLRPLSLAIFSHGKANGLLTRSDFKRAASHVCGINLTENVVDIIFHIFDLNRDGSLSSDEFLRVLQRREKDVMLPREAGLKGLLACWRDCATNCSSKML